MLQLPTLNLFALKVMLLGFADHIASTSVHTFDYWIRFLRQNGTAERSGRLSKALSSQVSYQRRVSETSVGVTQCDMQLNHSFVQLYNDSRDPPFGSQVIAQALGHGNIKYPTERSVIGRLMLWDHLSDQGSFILCPPDAEMDEEIVQEGRSSRFLAPPDTIPTPEPHDASLEDSSSQKLWMNIPKGTLTIQYQELMRPKGCEQIRSTFES